MDAPAVEVTAEPLASVIISTYNRRDALTQTLAALGRQTVPAGQYEVIVVDDGSSDGTYAAAMAVALPCRLTVLRHPDNRGVSAGRNLGIRRAQGRYLILLSDDLLVPPDFIAKHVEALERFPGWWVVGGFAQLPALRETPFGRYLDDLEKGFEEARRSRPLGPDLWELAWPTARNLSLPREHLTRIGLFDEQFRTTCEDQDLAQRARAIGVHFLYNAAITCLHNDQAGDLERYCRFQRRGAHDTALFCAKYPDVHGKAPVARLNSHLSWQDSPVMTLRKLVKVLLVSPPGAGVLKAATRLGERLRLPDAGLARLYRLLIGLSIFRGYREGLLTLVRGTAVPQAPGTMR